MLKTKAKLKAINRKRKLKWDFVYVEMYTAGKLWCVPIRLNKMEGKILIYKYATFCFSKTSTA